MSGNCVGLAKGKYAINAVFGHTANIGSASNKYRILFKIKQPNFEFRKKRI